MKENEVKLPYTGKIVIFPLTNPPIYDILAKVCKTDR